MLNRMSKSHQNSKTHPSSILMIDNQESCFIYEYIQLFIKYAELYF